MSISCSPHAPRWFRQGNGLATRACTAGAAAVLAALVASGPAIADASLPGSDITAHAHGGWRCGTPAVLPSLLTISNGLAGFGAIHFATKEGGRPLVSKGMSVTLASFMKS